MKILIVDDNEDSRMILEKILVSNGHKIEMGANGQEALKMARGFPPDMIISDILMPVMDGFKLCYELKADERLKHIPFVFYTATYTDEEDEYLALKVGGDRFIRKPMEPDELIKIIEGVIRDVEKGRLKLKEPALEKGEEVFTVYSERLVKKLEQKTLELESVNKELEESERRFRELIDNADDMIVIIEPTGYFGFVNPKFCEVMGYSTEEAKKLHFSKLIHPDDLAGLAENFERVMMRREIPINYEFRMLTNTGEVLYTELNATSIEKEDKIVGVQALIRNITERKRAEEELQKRRDEITKLSVIAKERAELQDWINTFDTFVGKFDPNGVGIIFNEAPIKAGGVSRDDVVGEYFPDTKWWSHSEIERARIVECLKRAKGGLSSRIETTFRSADGTVVPIIFNCQPVMDDDGEVKYITAEGKTIIEEIQLRTELQEAKEALETRVRERTAELVEAIDKLKKEIAERKRAEEELGKYQEQLEELVKERTRELEEKTTDLEQANIRLQELDRLKSMFIASMSHELRTPLNSIIGFTGIILQGMAGEITAEQRKQLTMVKNSGTHLLALINDVIDVSKIEAGKAELAIEEFDFSDLMEEVKDSFKVTASEKGLKMSLDTPRQLLIRNDRRRTKPVGVKVVVT